MAQQLHGIPTSSTFTVTDLTTPGVFSETSPKGGGNANHNQTTTRCTEIPLEGEAAQFFGEELPPGVASGTDTVRIEFEVQVAIKP